MSDNNPPHAVRLDTDQGLLDPEEIRRMMENPFAAGEVIKQVVDLINTEREANAQHRRRSMELMEEQTALLRQIAGNQPTDFCDLFKEFIGEFKEKPEENH